MIKSKHRITYWALILGLVSVLITGIKANTQDVGPTLSKYSGGFPLTWLELYYQQNTDRDNESGLLFMDKKIVGYKLDLMMYLIDTLAFYAFIKLTVKVASVFKKRSNL